MTQMVGGLTGKFDTFIRSLVDEDQFSGAVLVAKDGDVLYREGFGLASKAYNVQNQVDTKFNLGSMNKMFTSVAVGQLADQGLLKLDDFIDAYLPNVPEDWQNRIRIRHLLSHTSGLGLYWETEKFCSRWATLKTTDDYMKVIEDETLQFEPGSQFLYSNSGYVVLGAIIEQVSGRSYYDYVKASIFKPSGMVYTDSYDLEFDVPNLAIGYTKHGVEDPNVWRNNLFQHVVKGNSAGGGYSTVDDLYRFSQALLNHELVTPETTHLFTTAKVDKEIGPRMYYGYGFIEEMYENDRVVSHNGGTIGVHSNMDMYTQRNYVIVVLGNYDMGTWKICRHFRALIDSE